MTAWHEHDSWLRGSSAPALCGTCMCRSWSSGVTHVSRGAAAFLFFFAGLAAGQAVYWFIGGAYMDHSQVRNILVVLQLLIGVATMVWLAQKLRRAADPSRSAR
jgi:hypothetical protein